MCCPWRPSRPEDRANNDELKVYLEMEQLPNLSEWAGLDCWRENHKRFPNLSVMARQYLGCPATSASVERLFSAVGAAFEKKRKGG